MMEYTVHEVHCAECGYTHRWKMVWNYYGTERGETEKEVERTCIGCGAHITAILKKEDEPLREDY